MSEEKPKQAIADRSRLFAERYGYVPLPNVADYKLCHEFRYDFCELIRTYYYSPTHRREYEIWVKVATDFQRKILKRRFDKMVDDSLHQRLLIATALDGEFWKVLSIAELVLRHSEIGTSINEAMRNIFNKNLAPYAIDDSAEPVCIIPLDTPEAANATIEALNDIHQSGATSAHQHLRNAAGHINAEQYSDAIADSVHAVESIALELVPGKKLSAALNKLREDGVIDHNALKDGIAKLYSYASDTSRHGQPSTKAAAVRQTRDEALLIFSTCAAIAGYLARKKMQMEGNDDE